MNPMINCSRILAAALCGAVLAGCNAVEDVREEPFTPLPAQQAVLAGDVYGEVDVAGLGSKRSLVLVNTVNNKVISALANTPTTPYPAGTIPSIPFNFGNADVGSSYNIQIKQNPYGKECVVDPATATGVLTKDGAVPKIRVTCTNGTLVPRYNLTVTVPNAFVALPGATVRLTTEEQVRELPGSAAVASPVAGFSTLTFTQALLNPPAPAAFFQYALNAYTLEGNVTLLDPNRCGVSNAQNTANATGHVGVIPAGATAIPSTAPQVQPCTFTIGGNIGYSQPPPPVVASYTPQTIAGLVLVLKNKLGEELETLAVPSFVATAITTTSPYVFAFPARSNTDGIYDIAVKTQPAGMTCVVTGSVNAGSNGSAGGVSLYQPPSNYTTIPASVTNQNVRCRTTLAVANQLQGTYQLLDTKRFTAAAAAPTVVTTTTPVAGTTVVTSVTTTAYSEANVQNLASAISNPPGCTLYFTGKTTSTTTTTVTTNVSTTVGSAPPVVTNTVAPTTTTSPNPSGTTPTGTPGVCDYNNIRNFLTFFKDGTFLYGVHGGQGAFAPTVNALEHGFYYYDPTAARIYFTIVTDSAPTAAINNTCPGTACTNLNTRLAQSAPWNGLSGTPGRIRTIGSADGAAVTLDHPVMTGVVKTPGVVVTENGLTIDKGAKLVGRFGPVGTQPVTNYLTGVAGVNYADWTMQEPISVAGQGTGTWYSADNRQFWVYDYTSSYGFHVGVSGGSNNLQDNCYIFGDFRDTSGFYAQRDVGSLNCNAISQFEFAAGATVDVPSSQGGIPVAITALPGFVGRMPGSIFSNATRAASPSYYHIGTPATFFAGADQFYFPAKPTANSPVTDLSWCATDVFGARESVNTVPFPGSPPVYFCRFRAN